MKSLLTILITVLPLYVQAQVSANAPYTQPFDLAIYGRVLSQKQAAFDWNYKAIENQVNSILQRLESLKEYHLNAALSIENQLDNYVEKLNQRSIDYSDIRNCNRIVKELDKFHQLINNTYRDLEQAENSLNAPIIPASNLNRQAEIQPMTNLYENANWDSKVLHTFKSSEMVIILEEDPNFYRVKSGSYEGYIRRSTVKRLTN